MGTVAQEPESPSELPDDAIVVRGGEMERARTIRSAKAAFLDSDAGVYGLSVWSIAGSSATDIVELARGHNDLEAKPPVEYIPHGKMRTTTVGQLRAWGFGLRPDSPFGHYLLTIPSPPTDEDWDALQEVFGRPEPTPPKGER